MAIWSVVLMLVGLWQGASSLQVQVKERIVPEVPLSQQLQQSQNDLLALHRSV